MPAVTEDGHGSRCVLQWGARSGTEPRESEANVPTRIAPRGSGG